MITLLVSMYSEHTFRPVQPFLICIPLQRNPDALVYESMKNYAYMLQKNIYVICEIVIYLYANKYKYIKHCNGFYLIFLFIITLSCNGMTSSHHFYLHKGSDVFSFMEKESQNLTFRDTLYLYVSSFFIFFFSEILCRTITFLGFYLKNYKL